VVDQANLDLCSTTTSAATSADDLEEGEVLSWPSITLPSRPQHHATRLWASAQSIGSSGSSAWGQIPVWGFADVVASRHPEVAVASACMVIAMAQQVASSKPGKVSKSEFCRYRRTPSAPALAYNQYCSHSGPSLQSRKQRTLQNAAAAHC